MPSGAKKRKAEKKKKERLGRTDNGESKEEVGVVDVGVGGGGGGTMEEPEKSAGEGDVKDSPAAEVQVGGKVEGKSSSGSSDSSSDSSSDEEHLGVDVPISDTVLVPGSDVKGSDVVDDEGVEIEGKVDSFVGESKVMSEDSPGHVHDVVVEATPPISESDLTVESVVANTAPSHERIVDVVKPGEVEIREAVPENQGVEHEVGGSAIPPVERTSWRSCCGLFDLFSGTK